MRMLDPAADREEQRQSLLDGHSFVIAILNDGRAVDVLHDEVRAAFGRGARVEDPCDIRMIHHGQRLAFAGEASEYLTDVHYELHDFEGYLAANGFALLGQVHRAHAPFA